MTIQTFRPLRPKDIDQKHRGEHGAPGVIEPKR